MTVAGFVMDTKKLILNGVQEFLEHFKKNLYIFTYNMKIFYLDTWEKKNQISYFNIKEWYHIKIKANIFLLFKNNMLMQKTHQ